MDKESKNLVERLVNVGELFESPPSSVDKLYTLLAVTNGLLSRVGQSPSQLMLDALEPLFKALVAKDLLGHSGTDIKVYVASCISEITRITAPEAPYDDDTMKEIFKVIVGAFEGLDDTTSRLYRKRVSILETVAKVRSCVVMLDLECDDLILQMFHHFLKTIRSDHSESVVSSMETIMTLVLEESEDISSELFSCLLETMKKENKDARPAAAELAEKVMTYCVNKSKPCLLELVQSTGASLSKPLTAPATELHPEFSIHIPLQLIQHIDFVIPEPPLLNRQQFLRVCLSFLEPPYLHEDARIRIHLSSHFRIRGRVFSNTKTLQIHVSFLFTIHQEVNLSKPRRMIGDPKQQNYSLN